MDLVKATSIALAVLLALAGCAGPAATRAGGGPASSPGAAASSAAVPSPLRSADVNPAEVPATNIKRLRVVPGDARPGTAYPFDLYTHCGLEFAQFAGSVWQAEQPIRNGLPGYVAGTMELLDADTARFVIDLRQFAAPVEVVIFQRTSASVPHCK